MIVDPILNGSARLPNLAKLLTWKNFLPDHSTQLPFKALYTIALKKNLTILGDFAKLPIVSDELCTSIRR